ncbi:MAG: lysylphosphatidylglycerol synthase transmembrane domain-containing protein [Gammaproteobacteria bacterium]
MAIIAWLLHAVGIEQIFGLVRHVDVGLGTAAFGILFIGSIAKAWNWCQLLVGLRLTTLARSREVIHCYCSSALLGSVVPSTAGTDAVRAVYTQRILGGKVSAFAASVVVLNMLGWAASCTMGLCGLLWLNFIGHTPCFAGVAATLFTTIIAGACAAFLLLRYQRGTVLKGLKLAGRSMFWLRRPLRRFLHRLNLFGSAHTHLAPVFLTALLVQLTEAAAWGTAGAALGVRFAFPFWMVFTPLVATIGLIPASVLGFGANQAAHVYLLGIVGVPAASAFVLSAFYAFLHLFWNVTVGGLALMLSPGGGLRKDTGVAL